MAAPTVQMTTGGRPLQTVSWAEKTAHNKEWFKRTIDHFIAGSRFQASSGPANGGKNLRQLYEVYNNNIPLSWFKHITDPLSARDPKHKAFPARIRPVSILRTNIDLLLSEYPRRPFIYQVNNLSDDSFSSYQEAFKAKLRENVTNRFQLALQRSLADSVEEQQKLEQAMAELELPEEVEQKFKASYKDNLAIQGQRWLTEAIPKFRIRQKLLKQFKDWLITGHAYSYKGIKFGQLLYERVSPLQIDYDKSPDVDFVEDGEWIVSVRYKTISDLVDSWYPELTKDNINELTIKGNITTPNGLFVHLSSAYPAENHNKIPEYHVQWKGKAKKYILTMPDEFGEMQETELDEDTPITDEMRPYVQEIWVNEIYEGYRLGDGTSGGEGPHLGIYTGVGALPTQRNEINNFSTCKLSYNGRRYSDTHSEALGVLELGIPFLIMCIIINRTIEMCIAKSKGKILLIDKQAIPRTDGWTDEKFFYYCEGLGYGLLDRNQMGVDKSWNQYQVLDMTHYDQIKQLIELYEHYKMQWDDTLGITRQRKGQTYASDAVGVTERATFQSTVMTDMIFNLFEDFVQTELQGILDLSKFTVASGNSKVWNSTELGLSILDINPEMYCNASLGIILESSSEAIARKNKIEATVTAMLQNQVSPLTILKILKQDNIAQIEQSLREVEAAQQKMEEAASANEQEMAQAADERKKAFMEYEMLLKTNFMHEEYDRKEEIEDLKGTYSTFTFQDGDSNDNGVPDAAEVHKMQLDREKFEEEKAARAADRRERALQRTQDAKFKEKELALKDKQIKMQRAKAAKPKTK